jgi:predicted O-methyltransferase YrrM
MADQAIAQAGALKRPEGQSPAQRNTLRDKLARRWKAARCWARYAFVGRRRGVPGLVDFVLGNRFFSAIQVPSELAALGEILAERRPERALEIGTAWGGTLFFLTRLASARATIVSVDLPGGMFGVGYSARRGWFYQRFARRNQRLHLLQGDSHSEGMLERVKAMLAGQPIDYLFIDGDHTYEGVKKDFELYAPLVRRGGIIAFHDIAEHPPATGCEVSRLWNQVKSKNHYAELLENPAQGWAGIGVLYVD